MRGLERVRKTVEEKVDRIEEVIEKGNLIRNRLRWVYPHTAPGMWDLLVCISLKARGNLATLEEPVNRRLFTGQAEKLGFFKIWL